MSVIFTFYFWHYDPPPHPPHKKYLRTNILVLSSSIWVCILVCVRLHRPYTYYYPCNNYIKHNLSNNWAQFVLTAETAIFDKKKRGNIKLNSMYSLLVVFWEKLLTTYDAESGLRFGVIRTADPCSCTSNTTTEQSLNVQFKFKMSWGESWVNLKTFISNYIGYLYT